MTYRVAHIELPPEDDFTLKLPFNSQVLEARVLNRRPTLMLLTNTVDLKKHAEGKSEVRRFHMVKMGFDIPNTNKGSIRYIGTLAMNNGRLTFQLFESI